MDFLSKCWYIDNGCRFPAIILKSKGDDNFYQVLVYYGGVSEMLLAPEDKLVERVEDWSDKMFQFRYETMQVNDIKWNFKEVK